MITIKQIDERRKEALGKKRKKSFLGQTSGGPKVRLVKFGQVQNSQSFITILADYLGSVVCWRNPHQLCSCTCTKFVTGQRLLVDSFIFFRKVPLNAMIAFISCV